ncbi:MAG: DNA mismatch endonuclease Vsr [Nitrospirales bacterium]|nr:DNA mismatch endonuclease Vsr [Nitrospirales bacterium]
MADKVSASKRRQIMSSIRGKNTEPELSVRRLVHAMGYRYRLHSKMLPGRPDMVFTRRKKVIFVHGCFWHMHPKCPKGRPPKSNLDYWLPKLKENRRRDLRNQKELRRRGWQALIVWQCELKNIGKLADKIALFLESSV